MKDKLKESEEECFRSMLNFMVAVEMHLGKTEKEAVEIVKQKLLELK